MQRDFIPTISWPWKFNASAKCQIVFYIIGVQGSRNLQGMQRWVMNLIDPIVIYNEYFCQCFSVSKVKRFYLFQIEKASSTFRTDESDVN